MGKHSKPKHHAPAAAAALAGVFGTAVTVLSTGGAHAASVSTWDAVAQCESSGNWSIDTGNGFFGGLQFTSSTWAAYGGHSYAPQADQASKAQQITVAERVLAGQGPGAWPVCGPRGGLSRSGPTPVLGSGSASRAVVKAPSAPRTVSRTASTRAAQVAVAFVRARVGGQYVMGGNGPAFDCSGLTRAAWAAAGTSIPRTSEEQLASLPHVSLSALQPGDIVGYFGGSHVTMYVGGGMVVGAENPVTGIVLIPLNWGRQVAYTAVRPAGGGVVVRTVNAPAAATETGEQGAPQSVLPTKSLDKGKHTVRSGEWLSSIARADGVKGGWQALYAANRSVVGADPDLIYPGEVLALP